MNSLLQSLIKNTNNLINITSSTLDRITSNKYSENIENEYVKFIGGQDKLNTLIDKFDGINFGDGTTYYQHFTSRTTILSGTGLGNTSVQAIYTTDTNDSKIINLLNQSFDENFEPKYIRGITVARKNIPTCRIVTFPTIETKGNYWIIYVSDDKSSILVCSPIFPILPFVINNSLICYILSKRNHKEFWSDDNKNLRKELLEQADKFGFNNFINKPVPTGYSRNFNNTSDTIEGTEVTSLF
jgi:hypothetical protein